MHLNSPCHASHIICPQKHGGIGKCRSKQGDNSPAQQQIAVAVMKEKWFGISYIGREREYLGASLAMIVNCSLQLASKTLQATHHTINNQLAVFTLTHHLK